jgi:HD-like signal output (HDOD) protein
LVPLLRGNDTDIAKVVELIAYDPALTTRLFCRCNSVALSLATPVESVEDAVRHLGFNEVYHQLTMLAGQPVMAVAEKGHIGAGADLWRHSTVTAFAARFVARNFYGDEKSSFTAGLLHDIGKILLHWALVDGYPGVAEKVRDLSPSFSGTEKELPRLEYAELGGRVLAHWRFSENLVRAVWQQNAPFRARPHERLAAYVQLGNQIARSLEPGGGTSSVVTLPCAEALDVLEITPKDLETLVSDVDAALKEDSWFRKE